MKKIKFLRDLFTFLGFYSIGLWIMMLFDPNDGVVLVLQSDYFSYLAVVIVPFFLSIAVLLISAIVLGFIYVLTKPLIDDVYGFLRDRYMEEGF